MFFRSLFFDPFYFRILEVYLYIGITSLCLYIITEISLFQDVILYKSNKSSLYKIQKSVSDIHDFKNTH